MRRTDIRSDVVQSHIIARICSEGSWKVSTKMLCAI
jgi:hypothetical protein